LKSVLVRCPSWALFLFAFVLGAANVLAFAPVGLWPLQLIGLSGLFFLVYHAVSIRRVMQLTWLYCFAWLFFGVVWLTITMFRYGDMPVWLSFFCVALLSGTLALLPALLMGIATRVGLRYRFAPWAICLVLFPTLWSLAEWARGWIFTGFPWLVSGYAHNASPLSGFAPILGVYGITWLTAVIAGCVVLILERQRAYAVLILAILGLGGVLQFVHWTTPHGAPLTVRLLQGNVDQQVKFEREHLIDSLHYYFYAIVSHSADLVVTPESALPIPQQALPEGYLDDLQKFSSQTHTVIALGLFSNDGPDLYANSMISITPLVQAQRYRYDKHHLVPFGEFIPKGFGWFYHFMNIPMGDQQSGPLLAAPFPVKDQQILPNICYEDVFGEEIAVRISHAYFSNRPVPTILLNMTNIAWFGDSWAMPQHVQITQMRTLETGRPMLRSTNTGVTTLVNAQGHIVSQLAPFLRGELTVQVQGYTGMTPYIVCGNYLWLGLLCLIALVVALLPAARLQPQLQRQ
jgi:apolipoprotein N-acyltransferase